MNAIDTIETVVHRALDAIEHDSDNTEQQLLLGELIVYLQEGTNLWCEGQRTG